MQQQQFQWPRKPQIHGGRFFDERTINSRLVTLLTNPKKALKIISNKSTSLVKSYVRPKAKQTGVLVVVLMLLVVSVITWDLTHQSLSADGAEAPEGASAADGWLVTMDNRSEYGALILIQDISQVDSEAIQVVQPIMTLNSSYSLIGNNLVMANDTLLFLVDVNYPNIVLLEYPIDNPQQVLITSTNEQDVILILSDDKLEAISLTGVSIPLGITADDILFVFCKWIRICLCHNFTTNNCSYWSNWNTRFYLI